MGGDEVEWTRDGRNKGLKGSEVCEWPRDGSGRDREEELRETGNMEGWE